MLKIRHLVAASLMLMLPALPVLSVEQAFETAQRSYTDGDHEQAFVAFREAAEAGDERAFGRLGGMYLYGVGTERSFDRAYLWFTLAHATGDKYAEGFQRTAASMLKPLRIGELQAEAKQLQQKLGIPPR